MDALKYVAQQKNHKHPWYVVHPHSRGVAVWDLTTSVALIFTALVTPFEVAFLESVTRDGPWTLFILNRLIDVIFIIDMGLQFVIMTQVDERRRGSTDVDGFWEYRVSRLARRYMRMWFWVDLFSVIPSIFDILPAFERTPSDEELASAGGDTGGTERLKVLRIIRTLRLAKLVRLLRSSRVIERWETRIAIPYNELTLVQLFVAVLYATHLFACVLGLQTTFGPQVDSWYGHFGHCQLEGFALPLDAADAAAVPCVGVSLLYLNAFYWALGLILGFASHPLVGLHAAPEPAHYGLLMVHEQILFLILQFLGAIVWAYVTARLVDVIVNANPEATRFRQSIDDLNRFCFFNKLPKEMEIRLREYYIKRKLITQAESRQQVAEGLSPMLRGEVAWHINAAWLKNIPFLSWDLIIGRDKAHFPTPDPDMHKVIVRIALALRPDVYAPNEYPPPRRLYVIFNGLARFQGGTLKSGDHWGEWEVLLTGAFTRRSRARAVGYLHVLALSAETIIDIADDYPAPYRYIRRWICWRSLSEFLLDKLRRRRRNMALLVKRWNHRWPTLFRRMRIFMLVIYAMLKGVEHRASSDRRMPHRGRLRLQSTRVALLAAVDDATRLARVNTQLSALLSEQARLSARVIERTLPHAIPTAVAVEASDVPASAAATTSVD